MSETSQLAQRLRALSHDLWWTSQPEAGPLFRELDPRAWTESHHNLGSLLEVVDPLSAPRPPSPPVLERREVDPDDAPPEPGVPSTEDLAAGDAGYELYTHAVLVADDVHVRSEPTLGAESAGRLGADLQLFQILGRSANSDTVWIRGQLHEAPWLRVRLESGVEGYVYSAFFALFEDHAGAERFISYNQSFRANHTDGRVRCLVPEPVAMDVCADDAVWSSVNGWERTGVLLRANGTVRYVVDSYSGGDTFGSEFGDGRFYVHPDRRTLDIDALLQVEVTYDGDVEAGRELMGCNPCLGGNRRVSHSIPLDEINGYLSTTDWGGGKALGRAPSLP